MLVVSILIGVGGRHQNHVLDASLLIMGPCLFMGGLGLFGNGFGKGRIKGRGRFGRIKLWKDANLRQS